MTNLCSSLIGGVRQQMHMQSLKDRLPSGHGTSTEDLVVLEPNGLGNGGL